MTDEILLYDLLSQEEIKMVKSIDVRNVEVGDLTVKEIFYMHGLFKVKRYVRSAYHVVEVLDELLTRQTELENKLNPPTECVVCKAIVRTPCFDHADANRNKCHYYNLSKAKIL